LSSEVVSFIHPQCPSASTHTHTHKQTPASDTIRAPCRERLNSELGGSFHRQGWGAELDNWESANVPNQKRQCGCFSVVFRQNVSKKSNELEYVAKLGRQAVCNTTVCQRRTHTPPFCVSVCNSCWTRPIYIPQNRGALQTARPLLDESRYDGIQLLWNGLSLGERAKNVL
jgi:hypothetical protein